MQNIEILFLNVYEVQLYDKKLNVEKDYYEKPDVNMKRSWINE